MQSNGSSANPTPHTPHPMPYANKVEDEKYEHASVICNAYYHAIHGPRDRCTGVARYG